MHARDPEERGMTEMADTGETALSLNARGIKKGRERTLDLNVNKDMTSAQK